MSLNFRGLRRSYVSTVFLCISHSSTFFAWFLQNGLGFFYRFIQLLLHQISGYAKRYQVTSPFFKWAVPLVSSVLIGYWTPTVRTEHISTRGCLTPQRTNQHTNVVDEQQTTSTQQTWNSFTWTKIEACLLVIMKGKMHFYCVNKFVHYSWHATLLCPARDGLERSVWLLFRWTTIRYFNYRRMQQ